jgi:hypothetical protein
MGSSRTESRANRSVNRNRLVSFCAAFVGYLGVQGLQVVALGGLRGTRSAHVRQAVHGAAALRGQDGAVPLLEHVRQELLHEGQHRVEIGVNGFDFEQIYGDRGRGYIECHHVVPLHETGERRVSISDLALLCSNCYRMIHAKPSWPTPAELGEIIRRQAEGAED